jgi:polysaccharide pyruvyl transferase WcaK-like protein
MRQIADTDIVIASRFYNLICALKLNRPVVSLGYGQRHEELMAEMGLGAFCQPIEKLDVDRLIEQFTTLTLGRKDFARIIEEATVVYQKRLSEQESSLATMLL